MAKKFWKSAPSNWKEQAELNDRLRQQQMEEEAFGADTPSTVSQMLRTGRVLPSQPAQQRPKFQGPSPTPGGRGQPQAPVVTKAHTGTGRLVNGVWVPDEVPDWEKESAIPPRKSPLEYAAGAVGNTFGSLLRTPGEIARGVPRGAIRQVLESVNASNPAVAQRIAETTGIDKRLYPGTAPAGAGEQAGQLLTSLGGFAGPAVSPEEMAKNPLIGLGPEAQIATDLAMAAGGPAARQIGQGIKGYPQKLIDTAPRLVPERVTRPMALPREAQSLTVKNFADAATQTRYEAAQKIAKGNGFDLVGVQTVGKEPWFHLELPKYPRDGVQMDVAKWAVRVNHDKAPEITNTLHEIARASNSPKPFLPFNSLDDAEAFLNTGDTSKIAKGIERSGVTGKAKPLTKAQEASLLSGQINMGPSVKELTATRDTLVKQRAAWLKKMPGDTLYDEQVATAEAKLQARMGAEAQLKAMGGFRPKPTAYVAPRQHRPYTHQENLKAMEALKGQEGIDITITPEKEYLQQQARQAVLPSPVTQTAKDLAAKAKGAESMTAKAGQAKEPWEMSKAEWNAALNSNTPDLAGGGPGGGSKWQSGAFGRFKNAQSLRYGVKDAASQEIAAAAKGDITITPQRVQELTDILNANTTHRDVVAKALSEGKPVPTEVLADYPDLAAKAKGVETWQGVVYRGTSNLTPADAGHFGQGQTFSTWKEMAQRYAGEGGKVTENVVKLDKPYVIDASTSRGVAEAEAFAKRGGAVTTPELKAAGYDGVVVKGWSGGKGDEVVAFYPDKSVKPAAESVGAKGAVPTVPPSPARAPQVAASEPRIPSGPFKEGDVYPSVEGANFPQREAPLTVEGAGEGAMPPFGQPEPALGGAKPPTVPPTTGAVPPARGPKPQNVPQGVTDTLAQAAAIVERDRPGGITRLVDRLPGLRQVQRALHPSVGMPEHIIKAHIGGGHAEAVVSNRLRAEVTQTVKQLDTAFGRGATSGKGKNLAAFTGPAEKKVPFSGTLYDIMQRPDMYDLTAEQRQLLTAIHAGRSESFNAVKSYYGLKVREFPVPEGAVHLGNVDKTKGALEMAGSEQAAVRRGAAKERFYDTGADRYLHDKAKFPDNPDKWFTPVTDVAALMSRRADQELVTEAGQSVFKAGLGGKTRLEVLQEIDPRFANKMLGLKNRLAKLKGYGKILRDKQAEAIDDFLSGAMEDADLASLHSDLDVKLEPGRYVAKSQAGRTLADVQQEIDSVKAAIAELRPGWRTAKTNPYVMVTEGNLYQYYPASEAPIIRRLTERSNSATLRAFDNLRATAFGGDLSPASIQGVNSMLLDPLRTGRALFEVGPKRLFSEAAMAADVRANPESWALFTRATGLDPLIGPGAEYTTGFLGKIPKVGKYWNRFNETVYRPTQWAMKKSFDSIYADGVKMGLTSEQAAAIAADDVTKLIPNYSYRRMGMSQAQAAKYRAVLTSVSFLTQPAALMSDATKGILKMGTLQTLSPSEAYAVKRVLTLVAATETIAVVSNAYYASQNGKDVGQAIKESVSPTSGYFMSAVLPNGSRIGLGGPFRSIIKAVWPAEVKGLPAPVPFAGIVRFARAKVSPALSIVLDLARNQDYFGQKIMQGDFPINVLQGLEYAVEGAAPLTIGSAMEQVRRGTPEDIPSQMGSQFLGVNLVDEAPPSVWKAAEETNKVFRKLPFMSKYDINLGSIGSTFDKIVMTPEQRIVRQNTMGAVVTPRMKTFVGSPSFAKMKPDDQKVAIDKEMDRIKGMLTKVYNAYGKGEPAPDLTGKMAPTIKDLPTTEVEKHVLEIESLKPYLDIPDQVMAQMGNKKVKLDSGGFTTIKMYMELTDQLDQQAEDAAKAGDLVARDKYLVAAKARKAGNVYKAVSAEVTRLKNEYRKAHPEADALLYTWYGLTPKWKYQQKATPQPVVPTQSLATAGTLAR